MKECILAWATRPGNGTKGPVDVWCRKHDVLIGTISSMKAVNAETPALFDEHQRQIQHDREAAG